MAHRRSSTLRCFLGAAQLFVALARLPVRVGGRGGTPDHVGRIPRDVAAAAARQLGGGQGAGTRSLPVAKGEPEYSTRDYPRLPESTPLAGPLTGPVAGPH